MFGLWVHFRIYPILMVPSFILHEYYSIRKHKNRLRHAIKFTIEFGLVSGGVFLGLAIFFYYLYGYDFLYETYFYHLSRRDHRHSRSVHNYDLYLNFEKDAEGVSLVTHILRSLPNWLCVFAFGFYFVKKRYYIIWVENEGFRKNIIIST